MRRPAAPALLVLQPALDTRAAVFCLVEKNFAACRKGFHGRTTHERLDSQVPQDWPDLRRTSTGRWITLLLVRPVAVWAALRARTSNQDSAW